MKHGKKPTREQRKFLMEHGIDTYNCLVVKDSPTEMVVVLRDNEDKEIVIQKDS